MKEAKIKLYRFEELEENIQDIIIEKMQCNNDFAEAYYSEWEGTLEEFEKLMDIKVKNWEVSGCGYNYRVQFNGYTYIPDGYMHEIDGDDIKGKHLWRWLMNNVYDDIFPCKKYYKYDAGYNREKGRWNKQRASKVIRRMWDDCVLTGMCYDYEILKPIAEYMSKPYKEDYTLDDLVHDCLDSFFSAWQEEIEYYNSYEGVKEWLLEYDDKEYYENGKVFNGVLVEE